ncbi:MAG: hypothetical protein H5T41_00670 [Methanomassiliicoccales archaeon]|nr:hypothetical protein [Methanomassiliicoccales archaeon]
MSTTKFFSVAVVGVLMASIMLGLFQVSASNAFAPTAEANPRLIYWPPVSVWQDQRGNVVIDRGWIQPMSLAWSPSGKYLLIFGRVQMSASMATPVNTLIIDMEDGSLVHSFDLDVGYDLSQDTLVSFAFSSDETKIFYVTIPNTDWRPRIYSVNLDGTSPSFITFPNSTAVTDIRNPYLIDVTSDGALVYTSCETVYNWTSGQYEYTSYIWKHQLSTGEKSLVLELEGMDELITGLKVSPLNDKIAYATGSEIWVVDINGAEPPTKVTNTSNGRIAAFISWTSNGTMLTYSEFNGTITESGCVVYHSISNDIMVVNLDGSDKRVILTDGYRLTWSSVNASVATYIKIFSPTTLSAPYLIDLSKPITPNPDTDGDGLSDAEELNDKLGNFLNPLDPTDIYQDYDGDGLTNLEEINYGTYYGREDCDGDGLSDGVEVKVFRTNPTMADTDDDGVADGLEAAATGLNAFVSVLPEGWIRMTLQWSNKTMYVSTNSSVLGVVFNSTSMALTVNVGGPDGTTGVANITIPVDMISSLSSVTVTLDNQPIDFQISQVGGYVQIYVQYHHSFHELTTHLSGGGGGGTGGVDLTGILSYWWLILSIAIVAVASVIAAIIVKRG